ncbi:hypothetical protein BG003_011683 [Podila horticola]|nr:hypothetical protein BG003_011683 [Podila horticola]
MSWSSIHIYELIGNDITIDADHVDIKLDPAQGSIDLRKVDFYYLSRPNIQMSKGVDKIKPSPSEQ